MKQDLDADTALSLLKGKGWTDEEERDALVRTVVGSRAGLDVDALTELLLVSDPAVQDSAIARLRRLNNVKMVDTLMLRVAGHDLGISIAASERLAKIAPLGAAQRASWFLTNEDATVRAAAESFILAGRLDSDVLPVVLDWLKGTLPESRVSRILALLQRDLSPSSLAGDDVVEVVKALVYHNSPEVRREAYAILCMGEDGAHLSLFAERLMDETRSNRQLLREALRSRLPEIGGEAGRLLLPLLVSADLEVRDLATSLIRSLPQTIDVVYAFFEASRGMPSWVVERGLEALSNLLDGLTEPLTRSMLSSDERERTLGVQVACRLGASDSLRSTLASAVDDAEWPLRWTIARVLGEQGNLESLDVCARLLQFEPTIEVALEAIASIATKAWAAGHREDVLLALSDHRRLLERGYQEVTVEGASPTSPIHIARRLRALDVLGQMNHKRVWEWLKRSAEADREERVRRHAAELAIAMGEALEEPVEDLRATLEPARPQPAAHDVFSTLLLEAREREASDVVIGASIRPEMKVGGVWTSCASVAWLSARAAAQMIRQALDDAEADLLAHKGSVTTVYDAGGLGRFRLHAFVDHNGVHCVCRPLRQRLPTIEAVGLGHLEAEVEGLRSGLVLIGGRKGSGRTTTFHALIQRLCRARALHVVTLEGAAEYVHDVRGSLVVQRQRGRDFVETGPAIRDAVASQVDVLALDDTLAPEHFGALLAAARRGVLVIATSCARTMSDAVHHMIEAIPPSRRPRVIHDLTAQLRLITCQRLSTGEGSPLPIVEVIVGGGEFKTDIVDALYTRDEAFLGEMMSAGYDEGMRTWSHALRARVQDGAMSLDEAARHAQLWQVPF